MEETSSIRASCIGLRNSSSQKRVTEAMMMRKMENIEKLKDERMRSSLVRCQATLHVSIIIYKLHNSMGLIAKPTHVHSPVVPHGIQLPPTTPQAQQLQMTTE